MAYKLWEGSWDDGALLQDRDRGLHGDSSKIHKIHHVGKRYRVRGPAPGRAVAAAHAGALPGGFVPAGRDFAARNAEAQFIITPGPAQARELIDDTRRRVVAAGRSRGDLKFFQGLSLRRRLHRGGGRRKEAELDDAIDLDGMVAHLSRRGRRRLRWPSVGHPARRHRRDTKGCAAS